MLDQAISRPIDAIPRSFLANLLADPALDVRRQALRDNLKLFDEQEPAVELFCVHRGQVRLLQHGPGGAVRLVDIVGPEDVFGTASLAGDAAYGVEAWTVGQTVVSRVRAERLLASLARRPQLLVELTRRVAARLEDSRDQAADLIFRDCGERLIRTLVRLSRSPAASTAADGSVTLRLTHQQLAWTVGVARETVSLALTQLKEQGLVRTGRNRLVYDPERLVRARLNAAAAPPAAPS